MKQRCGVIVGLILAAGVTAGFGSGSQTLPEPKAQAPASTVDATSVYNQGVALVHERKFAAALVDFEKAVKA
jgi:hypothetical protein